MGSKYEILAFDYPFEGCYEYVKRTKWFVVAVAYMTVWSIKHFGVTVNKRG